MIDNPDLVNFCNEKIRPFCDNIAKTYYLAASIADQFAAKDLYSILIAASGDFVMDGSPGDGRTAVQGYNIIDIYNVAQWIVYNTAVKDNGSVRNQVLKVAVNP
jgi:hypothetical protein